jgi:hypothetical protein
MFDNEHGSITVDTAEACIAAAVDGHGADRAPGREQARDHRPVPGSGRDRFFR